MEERDEDKYGTSRKAIKKVKKGKLSSYNMQAPRGRGCRWLLLILYLGTRWR
jgi:hypothetical protein